MLTLAGIGFFLKRLVYMVIDHWKIILPVLAILVIGIFVYRFCNKPPKLDEKAIQKAQQAIAENDRKAMEEVLIESEVAEKKIDQNLANADRQKLEAISEARKKVSQMNNEELAAELERRAREE